VWPWGGAEAGRRLAFRRRKAVRRGSGVERRRTSIITAPTALPTSRITGAPIEQHLDDLLDSVGTGNRCGLVSSSNREKSVDDGAPVAGTTISAVSCNPLLHQP